MYFMKFELESDIELNKPEKYPDMNNNVPAGIVKAVIDKESLTIKYASEGFFNLAEYNIKDLKDLNGKQTNAEDLLFDDISNLIDNINEQINFMDIFTSEFKIHKKNNSFAWIMMKGNVISREDGKMIVMCIFIDITDYKESQKRLEIEQERYKIVAEISDDYLFEYDIETDTIFYSEKYSKYFNVETIISNYGDSIIQRNLIYHEDWENFLLIYEKMRSGVKYYTGEYRINDNDGTFSWYSICFTTIYDNKNVPIKSVGKITNIDSLKKENDKLREKAQRDPLTKLSNKITTQKLVEQYIKEDYDSTHAIMMIDIDDFKHVNDNFGHLVGDDVLTAVSVKLRKLFRTTDVVGRIGGDEFLVMLRGIQDDKLVDEKAEAICNIFRDTFLDDSGIYNISVSVGISIFPKDGITFNELFEKADIAVYDAKKNGKNCYQKYRN